MFKLLRRKKSKKIILWIVSIMMILSLGIFGTASYLDSSNNKPAGKIFGKKVKFEDFQKAYFDVRDQALMIHGDNFEKMSRFLDLRGETWDRLVLLQEAKKQNIKVSDEELISYLQTFPFFLREGKFDKFLYTDIITKYVFQRPTRDFEEGIRGQLIIRKLFQNVLGDYELSDEDVLNAYKKANERIQISYVLFETDSFLNESKLSSDTEPEEYFNANKQQFEIPPSINLEYVLFPYQDDMLDAQKSAKKDVITNTVYPELTEGSKSLKEVAEKSSLKIETTGFFSANKPILSLGLSFDQLNAAFASKEGTFIGPVESSDGIRIFRVQEKRPAYIPEYAEAKSKAVETVLRNKAALIAKTKADKLYEDLQTASSLKEAAETQNFPLDQTPFFAKGQYLPKIGISGDFQDQAFYLNEENKYSKPVKTTKGYVVMQFDAFESIDEAKFAEEKDAFKEQLIQQHQAERMAKYMSELRKKANLETYLSEQQAE